MLKGLDLTMTQPHIVTILSPCNIIHFSHSATNNLYTLAYIHQQLKYTHQSFSSPPIQFLLNPKYLGRYDDTEGKKQNLAKKFRRNEMTGNNRGNVKVAIKIRRHVLLTLLKPD